MYVIESAARATSFALGDIRTQPKLPWFTTGTRTNLISAHEALEAVSVAQFGDVGLHRAIGLFTNIVIPGAMKHSWLHTDDSNTSTGVAGSTIVEAVSEGVMLSNALHPYLTDYAILLRPKNVTEEQRKGACRKAKSIVGAAYDTKFKFNIEHELQFYEPTDEADKKLASLALDASEEALQKWNLAFSCSEAVAYCWWHRRKELSIYRQKFLGRDVILPIDYMHQDFDIVWCSKSWTLDVAKSQGLNEEGLDMLSDWKHKG